MLLACITVSYQVDERSTGMREAQKMLTLARSLGMKVMLGCMTETSCAISAASHLSPMVDWADLDGALLIKNDIFDGTKIINGKSDFDGSTWYRCCESLTIKRCQG